MTPNKPPATPDPGTDSTVADSFGQSVERDKELAEEDIQGSLAHVTMLGKQGILPADDVDKIKDGLHRVLQRGLAGRFSTGLAVVGVAAIFALVHLRPVEFPGLFVFGLVLGTAAALTGRLGMPILIHVGFNATALALVI